MATTTTHIPCGVICATLTPFLSETGAVDHPWIPSQLRFLESHGVDGVLTLGTTGEGPSLGLDERKRVLKTVLENRGNLTVFASTGCASLTETIALSLYALAYEATAVLVMPPFYFKHPPEEGVLAYYRALCDALPKDARVMLYHIPQVTGVPITPAVIDGLLESHSNQLYGIKDSSGDPAHTAHLVVRYRQLAIYSGSDSHIASSLAAGVMGVISACSNVWPDLVHAIGHAHQRRSGVEAAQQRLIAMRNLSTNPNLPSFLKAALPWTSNLPRTSVRTPLTNLSDEETATLKDALDRLLV